MNARPAGTDVFGRLAAITGRLGLVALIVVATAVLISALFLPAALATDDVLGAVRTEVLDVPPIGEADTPPQNSYVYAADGTELAELTFEENRVPVTLDEIPQVAIDAVLATEDAEFYDHVGVNHAAMVRAALANFTSGSIESGASTITQQYVKMAFLTPEQTLARKIEEGLYAIQIEDVLSKDEILERYLNRAYYGNGVYGIGTAAERYFSKDIGDLSLGEAATLAGLLRAPEANNPIRSLDNARTRRDIVLQQMAATGFVSQAQSQAAIDEPLETEISEPPPPRNPYWSRWISQLLVSEDSATELGTQLDALHAMGATTEERRRTVFQSGLRIHTTIDPELQGLAEGALMDHLTYEDEPAEEVAQEPMGAIVSVEPGSGAIRTMAIGPYQFGDCAADGSWVGETDDGRLLCDRTQVNPAVPGGGGSGRQPGSAFKPILDAAALEDGISPGLVLDATGPQEIDGCPGIDGDDTWTVRNSGGDGIIDMYEAVKRSSNVYHARLIADIGPDKAADMGERLSGFPIDERVCALALGANSMSPLAIASAYATLANRGEYCAPHPISHIEDANGRTIWEHPDDCEQVIDTEVADRVIDLLEGPVTPGGTAPEANLGEWETRGKTGTTNDNRDAWFVGFVKQLATASWIGYPGFDEVYATQEQANAACGADDRPICALTEPQLMRNVTIAGQNYDQIFGGTITAPMWTSYMSQAVQRFDPVAFDRPGPIPTGRVPNVVRADSVDEAEEIALEAGFRLTVDEVDDWRPAGTFLSQTPSAGGELALGGRITLRISNGTGALPAVPGVLGLTLDEAADRLFAAGYRVFSSEVETPDEDLVGRVVTMSPSAGTPLEPNAGQGVTVGVGVLAPEPDDDGEGGEGAEGDDDGPDDGNGQDGGNGGNGNGGGGGNGQDGGNGNGGNDDGGGNGGNDDGGGNGGNDGGGNGGEDPAADDD